MYCINVGWYLSAKAPLNANSNISLTKGPSLLLAVCLLFLKYSRDTFVAILLGKKTIKVVWPCIILALQALILSGCGGGGHSTPPFHNAPPVPAVTAPTISIQPENATAADGSSASFAVAASGSAPLSYQWKRDGSLIAGAISASYTIAHVTMTDNSAHFSVDVSNSAGAVSSVAATLTVLAIPSQIPPQIVTQPQAQAVLYGAPASFSVVASGTPPLTFQWRKNGVNISGATAATYALSATISADSGAVFDCLVINAAGSALSSSALLTVSAVYTTIVDAGSSTHLSFYEVIPGDGGYPQISKLFEKEYGDNGIANFLNGNGTIEVGNPGGLNTLPVNCPGTTGLAELDFNPCVLAPLLAAQDVQLTATQITRAQVKVELFGTTGMRTEDQLNGGSNTAQQILEYYQTMKFYVADMSYATGEFKTINGNSEEGVWAWVNLNDYYLNAFGGNSTVSPTVQTPVGDFEVGNSSMQIAFPTNATPDDAANVYLVSINGKTFNVNSKSILGLGAGDARKYVRAFNYNANEGAPDCFSATATVLNTAEDSGIALYPSNETTGFYPFPANAAYMSTPWTMVSGFELNLVGAPSFDSTTCSAKYDTVINQVISLNRNSDGTFNEGVIATVSSLKSILQTSNSPFVGIGNFYDTANDLGVATSTNFDPSMFMSNLQDICTAPIAGPTLAQQGVCANGIFMNAFLFGSDGLFNSSSAIFDGVLPSSESGNTVLSWERGYLLVKYAN
jgi:GDA1/CD39 (nucleoside phosphatase) family protein